METPLFSIIIPTYNRAALIAKTLDTVLTQTLYSYEVLIIDDGSTDNTEAIVQPYLDDKVKYYKKENAERAAARNYGTRLAKGAYVNWFDSDDCMFPYHLEEALQLVQQYKNPEIIALPYYMQTEEGKIIKTVKFPQPTINRIMPDGNYLACNPVFVRRDIALQLPFNEDRKLSASEDYELWMRMAARFPVYCGAKVTSALIDHDGRSMNNTSGDNMLQRYRLIIQYLSADDAFMKTYADRLHHIKASCALLTALYYSMEGKKKQAIKFLKETWHFQPSLVASKRFLVVVKNVLVK